MPDNKHYLYEHRSHRVVLNSPTAMPKANGFLWNSKMLLQMNCRGYAVAQFMQPEPASYSHPPNLAAKTFMMPEPTYFTHHPGRFFYIKDEKTGELFSAPYEPTRQTLDSFTFSVGSNDIRWRVEKLGLEVNLKVSLSKSDVLEIWHIEINNLTDSDRQISVYSYFTIGQMSWMNQSAQFDKKLNAVVASSITPYQKIEDYAKQADFKDQTFLLSSKTPDSYCTTQSVFEGEGGMHTPDGIQQEYLTNTSANYEQPCAVLQHRLRLQPGQKDDNYFLFGPAKNNIEIEQIRQNYFADLDEPQATLDQITNEYGDYIKQGKGCLKIKTADKDFDEFVNIWLPRQIFYHGDVNRLSSDPQTRNYLQDSMGMCFIKPEVTRAAFITALSQQFRNGEMPDGILLHPHAKLKYINQIPHTDHCVWLPICLSAYLKEHNDYALLNEQVSFIDSAETMSVLQHIDCAMDWLLEKRDHRGLSYIEQGDWCDPMNMVGHKGKGISAWLSIATAYAFNLWADICHESGTENLHDKYRSAAVEINSAVNQYLWDGDWFARGITDDNVVFGQSKDNQGRIFLNPQSWSFLSGAVDKTQIKKILTQVDTQLDTPFGVMMLAPSYTKMREDIGRITQKSPGVAENGSVYNHAAAFYAFALYQVGESQRAFDVLRKMIPDKADAEVRGQLPVYIPNYYRGAYHQFPACAGRSSQLFNTGTVSWFYRCLVEGLFGLRGNKGDLIIKPQLPKGWTQIQVTRCFAGATFEVCMIQSEDFQNFQVIVDGKVLKSCQISNIRSGKRYHVKVNIPLISGQDQV